MELVGKGVGAPLQATGRPNCFCGSPAHFLRKPVQLAESCSEPQSQSERMRGSFASLLPVSADVDGWQLWAQRPGPLAHTQSPTGTRRVALSCLRGSLWAGLRLGAGPLLLAAVQPPPQCFTSTDSCCAADRATLQFSRCLADVERWTGTEMWQAAAPSTRSHSHVG